MQSSGSPQDPRFSRINVTPIIDVALVLVIILLITAPILSVADLGVDLPRAESRGAEDEQRLSITMSAAGQVAIDEDIVPREALGTILRTRIAAIDHEDLLVVVRADANIPHRQVSEVLKEARAAGAKRLALATMQSEERNR